MDYSSSLLGHNCVADFESCWHFDLGKRVVKLSLATDSFGYTISVGVIKAVRGSVGTSAGTVVSSCSIDASIGVMEACTSSLRRAGP